MLAQKLDDITTQTFGGGFAFSKVGDFFGKNILSLVFTVAGILLLIYLMLGGLQMMFAKGDPKAVAGAWAKITNALIGFVIVFAAFWIVQIFGNVLNIPQILDIFK